MIRCEQYKNTQLRCKLLLTSNRSKQIYDQSRANSTMFGTERHALHPAESASASLILLFTKTEFQNQAIMKHCTIKETKKMMIGCNCNFIQIFFLSSLSCVLRVEDEINAKQNKRCFSLFTFFFTTLHKEITNKALD